MIQRPLPHLSPLPARPFNFQSKAAHGKRSERMSGAFCARCVLVLSAKSMLKGRKRTVDAAGAFGRCEMRFPRRLHKKSERAPAYYAYFAPSASDRPRKYPRRVSLLLSLIHIFKRLAEICQANNNLWCGEAEAYLLAHAPEI